MRVNIQLPSFHGFYESLWSAHADDIIEEDFRERGIIHGEDWTYDVKGYEQEVADNYAEMYVDLVNSELGFDVKLIGPVEVDSPRYYNYRTDRIYLDVEFSDLEKLKDLMKKWENELRDLIHEHHTSRDGFISFMSNDFDEWVNEYLDYEGEDFGLYLSYAMYYVLGLEHGWDIDFEFADYICGNVFANWYPLTEVAKEELEKVEAVEKVKGWGAYDSEKWENVSVEEVKLRMAQSEFDRKYHGKLFEEV